MAWQNFSSIPNNWSLTDCIVRTTYRINPRDSFPTIGRLTFGGMGLREHKNITDIIIPAFSIGYLKKADPGANGSLILFDFTMNLDFPGHVSSRQQQDDLDKAIKQFKMPSPNRISVMFSANDMKSLQILIGKR